MAAPSTPKAPRKPRTRKPDPATVDAVEAALTRLVNPPEFVAGSAQNIRGVNWNVSLFSDDTVRIRTSGVDVAVGRFVTSTHRNEYGYSVSADIVDVSPVDAVSADILQSLSNDLTYFAMRAGRFSGGKGA